MNAFERICIRSLGRLTRYSIGAKAVDLSVRALQMSQGIGLGDDPGGCERKAWGKARQMLGGCTNTVFDVGANKGQWLTQVALPVLMPEEIHCFEPQETAFYDLKKAVASAAEAFQQSEPSVILNKIALSDRCGEATLWYDHPGAGTASLAKRDLRHIGVFQEMSETVALETLEKYCARTEARSIDVLKLDCEGYELSILNGATAIFEKRAIRAVQFEFGGCAIDTRIYFRDYYNFFSNFNFSIFRISMAGDLLPITRYSEMLEQFRTTNFIAIGPS